MYVTKTSIFLIFVKLKDKLRIMSEKISFITRLSCHFIMTFARLGFIMINIFGRGFVQYVSCYHRTICILLPSPYARFCHLGNAEAVGFNNIL